MNLYYLNVKYSYIFFLNENKNNHLNKKNSQNALFWELTNKHT